MESALRWFESTHELTNADGRFWYRRTALPASGGAGAQEAWLLEAFDLLTRVYNDMANVPPKRKKPADA